MSPLIIFEKTTLSVLKGILKKEGKKAISKNGMETIENIQARLNIEKMEKELEDFNSPKNIFRLKTNAQRLVHNRVIRQKMDQIQQEKNKLKN